ncbi:hypothetical protein GOODEAATRI_025619 [Goodea atripinnis]|uniref:Uncharacterized protein n=1 Tax=Goodea atripinnis TaxID=208336 RepID=A0ABV0N5L8_9TELE
MRETMKTLYARFSSNFCCCIFKKTEEEFYHPWMTTRSAEELLCFDGSLVLELLVLDSSALQCTEKHRQKLKREIEMPSRLSIQIAFIKKKKSDVISFFLVVCAVQWLIKWRSLVFEVFCTK